MKYQDTWSNGYLVASGNRECANRYEIIKKVCQEKFNYRFSVCDIGANMAYFGIRMIEDFNCNVLAFEYHQYEQRKKVIEKNKVVKKKLMYVNRKLSLNDLSVMRSFSKFDLVLALSVLHHVSEPIQLWIDGMLGLSKYVIIEFAGNDSHLVGKRVDYNIPPNGILLGYGDSHLEDNFKRPIILYQNEK